MWSYTLMPRILNMSITAGITIVFVMLARIPLKKAPKIFSYALWAVVLFRLVCPVSFSSQYSLFGILDTPAAKNGSITYIPTDIVHTEYPKVHLPLPGLNDIINKSLPQGEEQLAADPLEGPMAIATMLWILGMAVMLIYSAVSLLMLRRRLIGAVRLRDNIYLADRITTPFVTGFLFPKIYLPSFLTEKEHKYIILHEQTHIRRLDHVFKLVAFLSLSVHWFNPLVWAAFICCVKDMEMSCDERVLKEMGGEIKGEYAKSILALTAGLRFINSSPLAFGEGNIKERIKNVMNFKKPAVWVLIVSAVLVAILSIGFAANRADPGSPSDPMKSPELSIDETKRKLTVDDVRELARKGDKLKFEDFKNFLGGDVSSNTNYHIMVCGVEGGYRLIVRSDGIRIDSADLESIWENSGSGIDIRYSDVDEFIEKHPSSEAMAKWQDIEIGMTREDVHRIMGEPDFMLSGLWGDGYELDDGSSVIFYYNQEGKVQYIK